MTASLHKLGVGANAGLYYTNDATREVRPNRRDEYYAQSDDGIWWSSSSSVVAHGSRIDVGSFRDLCAGRHPGTGINLVRGAGEGHWAGIDVTCTPGKSFSILWMAGSKERRSAVEAAHQAAIDRTLRFIIDEKLVVVRQGAGGVEHLPTTDLIVATFPHFTTREGDPNLHTHCVVMNVAGAPASPSSRRCATTHLTIEPEKLFKWQRVVGAVYRSALAEHLTALGLSPRPAGKGQWEVAGLPKHLLEAFSKRSQQIEERVGSDATSAQKEIAALATRRAKEDVPTGQVLEQRWREELIQTGVEPWEAAQHPAPDTTMTMENAIDRERQLLFDPPEIDGPEPVAVAASELFRHESVVDRKGLLERAFVEAALQRLGPDDVYSELARLESEGKLLRLDRECWTTAAIAKCEAAMLRAANRPQEREWVKADALAAALERAPYLTPQQQDAVRQASNSDGLSIVEAGAGTGKTTLACAIADAANSSGLRVIGLAPSWVAADELARSTKIEASVIAKWRHDLAKGNAPALDAQTMIVVDEAGMTGTRDMSAILTAAEQAGAKVVLMGDRRQLESASGASALKGVTEIVRRAAVLHEVRRQRIDWQRAATNLMARGDAEAGLRAYASHGQVELVSGDTTAQQRVIDIWQEQRTTYGDNVLIVTRRNSDSAALNRAARSVLKTDGILEHKDIELMALDRDDKPVVIALAIGDRVRFSENLPDLNIRNGNRAFIRRIERDESNRVVISFELDTGRVVEGPWERFARNRPGRKMFPPKIVHAYAGTVYAAQGQTAAASVLYIARPTDAREIYVGLTRHRQDARIVVERERLDAMCRQRQADHRVNPTKMAIHERLFSEAMHYREKINVVDYCIDRSAFIRSGMVELPESKTPNVFIDRAVHAARKLREILAALDPSRIVVPIWRLIEKARWLKPELSNGKSITDNVRERSPGERSSRNFDYGR